MEEKNREEPKEINEEQKKAAEAEEEPEVEEAAEEIAEEVEDEGMEEETGEEKEAEAEKAEEKTEEAAETEEEAPEKAEEEAKPPTKKEKPEEEEIVEERVYTIPLSKAWIGPPRKRAPRAMRILKTFVTKHMKLEAQKEGEEEAEEPKKLVVSNEVNELVWSRGIEKPPRNIRVRVAKDKEGNVSVYLAEGD